MEKLLIVDDDAHLRALVKTYAELDGFQCTEAENGKQAVEYISQSTFDMIVLDVMMPGKDGFETLADIRQTSDTPVIMLTARKEEYDKLLGFNLGADDYLAKPFSPKELMARIRAILKRSNPSGQDALQFGGLIINGQSHTVTLDGEELSLTPKEFDLLVFLAANKGIAFSREKILQKVWNYDYIGEDRTVDTHVKMLRSHLGKYRDNIVTVWGVGYKFSPEVN